MATYINRQTGQTIELPDAGSPDEPQGNAAQETGPLDAALINAGEAFSKIGETTGLNRLLGVNEAFNPRDPANQQAMNQLETERPVASIVGKALPYAALPGGIATQTGYSAAVPFLEEGFTDDALMQSAAGAGMTRGLDVFGRFLADTAMPCGAGSGVRLNLASSCRIFLAAHWASLLSSKSVRG